MIATAERRALAWYEWTALAAAVLVALGFKLRMPPYLPGVDAVNYLDIARDIEQKGLFSNFYYSNLRTYGYPLLLAALHRIADVARLRWDVVIFVAQLVLYLGACLQIRRAIARQHPAVARLVFVALACNPFALLYTPESLSESVALSLAMLGAAAWIEVRNGVAPLRHAFLGAALLAYAVMVRPATLFALAAWWVALPLVLWERRSGVVRSALVIALAVLGTVLPAIPEVVNNVRDYGQPTPFASAQLGHLQQIWGIQYVKYGTAVPPVPLPSVFYDNPFAGAGPVDPQHPLHWYLDNPAAGARTLGLHVFNMLDQDLLFTYANDLDPWYRRPVGVVNHALIALGLVGAGMLAARRRGSAVPAAALLALVLAHLGLHATTAVEMRFGLPLLVIAGALAAWVLRNLVAWRRPVAWWAVAAFVGVYVGGALILSDWVREHSAAIRTWQAAHPRG